ncbi:MULTISPECIES: ABC transporter ATP-binding protein [Tepidanaerobacter]|uniref:ABC transporter ATP-binding protein n=1 Tax=Tepidanaerobacter TaxID=499228 RepID=UPI000AC16925|nr:MULTISPECIES: ABC transporter ATP-binding protein [Tepidanaerobacter]GLI51437.1 ABC transporter ATP-binding protein [Tepidanaerobacter syntrophicus]
MDTQTIIEIQNLVKQYGSITAVDNLNLSIYKGEIFGLLGPNGAGKTTTILMLMGLCEPTSGSISVAGLNPAREPILVKKIVGYMPDSIGFYGDMTGRENLYYTANLNRIPKEEQGKRIDFLLSKVGLKEAADRKVREYSRGMRQRLGVADVLLKDPEVVFLDEPTLGLDPEGTAELLEIIKELGKKEGKTVLISSHLLHQVQAICDRVGIFVKGKLVASGTISELAQKIGGERAVEIKATPLEDFPYDAISAMPGVDSVSVQDDMIIIDGVGEELAPKIVKALVERGMNIYHVKVRGSDLDDIYRRYFQEEGAKNDK